ncbi:MAG TPA: VCBS repeat-containing protein [Kofleriaceae bacterium]|jgi:hypothetical protein|nr:VCBS repeat-containing protein [Kofleriaceae bacterium]
MRARIGCGLAALVALALAGGCHDLPALGTCGNGIAEQANGEACDDPGDSATCTASCELRCTATAVNSAYVAVGSDAAGDPLYCPGASYHCGTDQVCRAPSGRFAPLAAALAFDVVGSPVIGDVDNDGLPDLVGTSATSIAVRFGSTEGTPLAAEVVQAAPSSDAPYAIFDLSGPHRDPTKSATTIAIPTEGVALLASDGERFAPQLDLAIPVTGEARGLIMRDPDPALGDVVLIVQSHSTTASIAVIRAPIDATPGVAMQVLPPCVGAGGQIWHTIDVVAAPDRRSFVLVTARDSASDPAGQPWHVCRYTQAGTAWTVADLDLAAPTPSSIVLANLDGDPCLELAVHRDAVPGLAMLDASGAGCDLAPAVTALPIAGAAATAALLGAGAIVPGGVDELVLADGVYQACSGPGDCGASAAGTFVRVATPSISWSAVALADLNGDGALDVVAARSGDPDVDVVRGGAVPNLYRASTSVPVTSLVAGDFDGDRLGDVAIVESGGAGDQVAVLFGTRDATLGAPVAMSPAGGTLRLDVVHEIHWLPTTRGSDGIDDLLVVDSSGTPAAGLLIGDAARLMTTPRFPPMATGTPLGAVAAGAFGSDDVEVLAVTGDQVQLYNVFANAWAPPATLGPQLRPPVGALRDGTGHARGAARGAGDHDLVVFGVRGAISICPGTAAGAPRELRGIDLDGDGTDELAVLADGDDGAATLQLFRAASCPLVEVGSAALAGCIDVAAAGSLLVALCRIGDDTSVRGLFTLAPSPSSAGAGAGAGSDLVRAAAPFATLDGEARFVTAGDYDGDGVLDLAVGVQHGAETDVQLLHQCPAHDTRACPSTP